MKLATAGCPRNCSEAMVKDVGAVAVEGGKWEIYVGGAAGSHVRKGDILCVVDSHEEVLHMMGRFMQYYRENAKYLERTLRLRRAGRHREDSRRGGGRRARASPARLDRESRPRRRLRDPWPEAAPAEPTQFTEAFPAAISGGGCVVSQAEQFASSPEFLDLGPIDESALGQGRCVGREWKGNCGVSISRRQSFRDRQSMPPSGRSAQRRCRRHQIGPRAPRRSSVRFMPTSSRCAMGAVSTPNYSRKFTASRFATDASSSRSNEDLEASGMGVVGDI